MAQDSLMSDRNLTGGGLYSLRGGRASQVQSPAPGVNTPGPPSMRVSPMASPMPVQQQQNSSANLYNMLAILQSLFGKNTAGLGQAGAQMQAQPQARTTLPRGYGV